MLQYVTSVVMFEEPANLNFHNLIKSADYLSADCECWRQYLAGSRDPYFLNTAITSFERDLQKKSLFFHLPVNNYTNIF